MMSDALTPNARKILMKAYRLRDEGKIEASLKQARAVAKKHADDPIVCYLLGSLYNEKNHYPLAKKTFEHGIRNDPQGHINQGGLGAVYYRMGEDEKARRFLELAHYRAPEEYAHLDNLGQVYYRLGETEKAAQLLERAFTHNPANKQAALMLAKICLARESYNKVQKILTVAVSKNPDDVELLHELACYFEGRSHMEPVLRLNQKILEIRPDFIPAHLSLYNAWAQEGETEKAKDHLRQIARLDGENIPALSAAIQMKAETEIFGENLDKAYKNALDLARSKKGKDNKQQVRQGGGKGVKAGRNQDPASQNPADQEKKGQGPERTAEMDHATLYELSAIVEKCEDYATAFRVLKSANDKKKQLNEFYGRRFDRGLFKNYIQSLKDFDQWKQLFSRVDSADDRMVFIAALPRCGTTLMEQILAAHPKCDGVGESGNLDKLKQDVIGQIVTFPPFIGWPERFMALSDKACQKLPERYLENTQALLATKSAPKETRESTQKSAPKEARKIVEKSIGNFLYLGLLAAVFPKAKFIHAKRRRAAAGLSIYQQNFSIPFLFDTDLHDINFMFDVLGELMRFWQDLLGHRILTVAYEDLVREPEVSAKTLVSHMGLDWDPACLEFYKNPRRIKTASRHQVRSKVYATSAERYLNYRDYLHPLLSADD